MHAMSHTEGSSSHNLGTAEVRVNARRESPRGREYLALLHYDLVSPI